MTKKEIIFSVEIKQRYIESEGKHKDRINRHLKKVSLKNIRARLKWYMDLTDEEFLKYCKIEDVKWNSQKE